MEHKIWSSRVNKFCWLVSQTFHCTVPLRTVCLMSPLSSWLLGQAVPAGSHVRLNLQTGAREVKLQEEDKFQSNLKGLKKGRRYSDDPRDWEVDNIDFVILKVMKI